MENSIDRRLARLSAKAKQTKSERSTKVIAWREANPERWKEQQRRYTDDRRAKIKARKLPEFEEYNGVSIAARISLTIQHDTYSITIIFEA